MARDVQFAFPGIRKVDWERACRFARRWVEERGFGHWYQDRNAHQYMALRNGYLSGYKAGKRAKR